MNNSLIAAIILAFPAKEILFAVIIG